MRLLLSLRSGIALAASIVALGAASALSAAADTGPSPTPASTSSPTSTPTSSPTSTPAPCSGSADSVLACIKQRAAEAISQRETALQKMASDLNGNSHVSASDRATLLAQIQADESGLTALNATIQADTTAKQARSDALTIVTGYRVYVLEGPKVHLVIAADTEGAAETKLQSVMPAIQTAIDKSTAPPDKRADAQAAFNDITSHLAQAVNASSSIASSVIGLEPSGYPSNKSTLTSARGSAETARQDLEQCRHDLSTIREDLGH